MKLFGQIHKFIRSKLLKNTWQPYTSAPFRNKANVVKLVFGLSGVGLGSQALFAFAEDTRGATSKSNVVGSSDEDLPLYTSDDVKKHVTKQTGIWVSYDGYVYDVTKFIARHPGGPKIKQAAGCALEPFWQKYPSHLRPNSQAKRFLEKSPFIKRVGRLDVSKISDSNDSKGDKLNSTESKINEPERDKALITLQPQPCNAEPPGEDLADMYLTPSNLFFVRNHGFVPTVDPGTYKLVVGKDMFVPQQKLEPRDNRGGGDFPDEVFVSGDDEQVILGGESVSKDYIKLSEFTLEDLKTKFPKAEVDVTIICAGNRRKELHDVAATNGLLWDTGAGSTARWGGVRLTDLVRSLGTSPEEEIKSGVTDVIFVGIDDAFDSSVPAEKALRDYGDVILAYEMNGEPIPRDHGYPLRAVIPGVVGVRNVKWVKSLTLANHEARSPWQRGEQYKGFPPNAKDSTGLDVASIPSIQSLPVQSAILVPRAGSRVETHACSDPDIQKEGFTRCITTKGWAYSGGGKGIARVDVSIDGGKRWFTAKHTASPSAEAIRTNRAWAWTLWKRELPVDENEQKKNGNSLIITAKAVDTDYNTQPESPDPIWNYRGVLNNSWHKVKVSVEQNKDK